MSHTTVSRTINARINLVFNTAANITEFSKALPHIVKVEFLTNRQPGVGTKFLETRLFRGKEMTTELEVTEYVENERCRIVSDTHGNIWDSVMTVKPQDDKTVLTLTMDAITKNIFNKVINSFIGGMLKKQWRKILTV